MGDYIRELRELVGSRPLVISGSTVAVLNPQSELLMLRRSDNRHWALPGGSLEPGESLETAARRETREEVGIEPGALELLQVCSGPEFYYVYPNGDQAYYVVALYLCRDYAGELRPDPDEVLEVGFFGLDRLPEPISPPDRLILAELLVVRPG